MKELDESTYTRLFATSGVIYDLPPPPPVYAHTTQPHALHPHEKHRTCTQTHTHTYMQPRAKPLKPLEFQRSPPFCNYSLKYNLRHSFSCAHTRSPVYSHALVYPFYTHFHTHKTPTLAHTCTFARPDALEKPDHRTENGSPTHQTPGSVSHSPTFAD